MRYTQELHAAMLIYRLVYRTRLLRIFFRLPQHVCCLSIGSKYTGAVVPSSSCYQTSFSSKVATLMPSFIARPQCIVYRCDQGMPLRKERYGYRYVSPLHISQVRKCTHPTLGNMPMPITPMMTSRHCRLLARTSDACRECPTSGSRPLEPRTTRRLRRGL